MPSDANIFKGMAFVGSVSQHIRSALLIVCAVSVLSLAFVALRDGLKYSRSVVATITAVKGAETTLVPGSSTAVFSGFYEVSYDYNGTSYTGAIPAGQAAMKGLGGSGSVILSAFGFSSDSAVVEKELVLRVGDVVTIHVSKSDPTVFTTSRLPLTAIWSCVSSSALFLGAFALAAVLVVRKNRTLAAAEGLRLI